MLSIAYTTKNQYTYYINLSTNSETAISNRYLKSFDQKSTKFMQFLYIFFLAL